MKYTLLILIIIAFSTSLIAEPLPFMAPQFLQSYFDHYANNYLNAISAGRGHTGVGLEGNIENVLQNPAAFTTDHDQMFFEIFIKPPVTEYNTRQEQQYESLVPIGMWAYGLNAGKNFCLGANYSTPQSLEYNAFLLDLPTGDVVFHYPSFYLYQLTLTGNYQWNNLRIGLNLLNELYRFKDQVTLGTALYDRVDHVDYVLRLQPGLFYTYRSVSFGTSYVPATKHSFDFRYQTFDTTLPSQLNAGISLSRNVTRIATDINLVNCSEMSDKFKNRLNVKAGIETDYHKYTLRCGFMKIPSVWNGMFQFPSHYASEGQVFFPPDSLGVIKPLDQAMLTGGFTWHSDFIDLTLAFVQDIENKANFTEVMGSFSVNLSKFSFKKLLPGNKEEAPPVEDDTEIEYLE